MHCQKIIISGASEHNLKNLDLEIERGAITVVTGVSGSGKSSLAFDTVLAEAQRRFFYTLSNYSRQILDLGSRPAIKAISGLSPAISLAQNETMPSKRATVGSLSDVSELLGVLFARFGSQFCPDHELPCDAQSVESVAARIESELSGQTIALCVPVAANKKGTFATVMDRMAAKGFSLAYVDGDICQLSPVPKLKKEEKHTIKIFIDVLKVNEKNRQRLIRSIESAMEEGGGFGEYYQAISKTELDLNKGGNFSEKGGCPQCGYSWPYLDSRYFSANSLGKCSGCKGYGSGTYRPEEEDLEIEEVEDLGRLDAADMLCKNCFGTGLAPKMHAIKLQGKSAVDCQLLTVDQLHQFIVEVGKSAQGQNNPALSRVVEQVGDNLARILDVGLGYLELKRRVRSLSGGESQRLKLAGILGESLKGILYVLDEPSQGLHPSEINSLGEILDRLKKMGNTLLIVDHDETLMKRADWIIDLGPGGGTQGGRLMAKFHPDHASKFKDVSLTAKHLAVKNKMRQGGSVQDSSEAIVVSSPSLNNLKLPSVKFLKSKINVVSGVSGAGKSSLVLSVLFENVEAYVAAQNSGKKLKSFRYCENISGLDGFESVHLVNRKPIAKSSVSMPATYLDVFTDMRNFYGKLPESQIGGLTPASFSLAREGGRCEECKGRGQIRLKMRFLADARVKCHVCNGKRYRPHILDIKFNGLSLGEVLELTIDDVLKHFKTFVKIQKRLEPAVRLGLGYLKIGQPSASLSGGEAQRLKLVPFFVKKHGAGSLVILDEPTSGLHFEDVNCLLESLDLLVKGGATVILIEHNIDVAISADWLIDLGPGAADEGGQLVFQGRPEDIGIAKGSRTKEFLI